MEHGKEQELNYRTARTWPLHPTMQFEWPSSPPLTLPQHSVRNDALLTRTVAFHLFRVDTTELRCVLTIALRFNTYHDSPL
jgi:hypothetical protein